MSARPGARLLELPLALQPSGVGQKGPSCEYRVQGCTSHLRLPVGDEAFRVTSWVAGPRPESLGSAGGRGGQFPKDLVLLMGNQQTSPSPPRS